MTLTYFPNTAVRSTHQVYRPNLELQPAPSVSIRNLTKSFPARRTPFEIVTQPFVRQRTTVVRGITLDVREGELFGILGLNGAGKTTLLKMLATLLVPDGGSADIDGHDICDDPHAVREVAAMVSAEERSLNWRLSATENLRLFAGLHRLGKAAAAVRVADALTAVGLSDSGSKMVGAFSSGMRQRLILARALLAAPRLLLMDEPTRSLDPVTAHEFRRMLRDDIVDRGGATVILATHNAEEAFTYCDRVAVLHHGRVAALGTGAELAARFGENRYRVWTSMPYHPAFETLLRRGLLSTLDQRADVTEGESVDCVIAGDEASASEVLRSLVEERVSVSRFERTTLPLSSLITRIVAAHDSGQVARHA